VPSSYNFRTPILAKVYSRLTVGNYFISKYDTRVVRYAGSQAQSASTVLTIQSVVAIAGQITINFSSVPILTGVSNTPAGWTVSPPMGNFAPVAVLTLSVVGNAVILTTSEQTGGGAYTLNVSQSTIFATNGTAFTGPFGQAFTGVGSPTPIAAAISIDEHTLEVIFTKAVIASDAVNPANYVLSPTVPVLSVDILAPNTYRLHTGPQAPGTMYTLTASNIRDLAFNPI
jgi:hypothetical protein